MGGSVMMRIGGCAVASVCLLMIFLSYGRGSQAPMPQTRASQGSQEPPWYSAVAKVETKSLRVPGTAFVVAIKDGMAYLVTSAHVVAGDSQPSVTFRVDPDRPRRATVRAPELGDEKGLALLIVSGPPPGAMVLASSDSPAPPGTQVSIAGYPSSVADFAVDDPCL